MQSIDFLLERIIYSDINRFSESGLNFVIARGSNIKTGENLTVKGEMLEAVKYESYRLFGDLELDEKYNEHVFKFRSFHIVAPIDKKGAYKYLIKYCRGKGIGPVSASEIVDFFGSETIEILMENPDKIFEAEFLTDSQAESINNHFKSSNIHHSRTIAELSATFDGFRVYQKTIELIATSFGSSALEIINKNPYILINFPRMGFDTVDAIARQKFNIGIESPVRIVAAIGEVARKKSDDGHTCYERTDLEKGIFELVGKRAKDEWFDWAIRDDILVQELVNGWTLIYQLKECYEAERSIALNIARLTRDALPLNVLIEREGLEGDQLVIPDLLLENGVAVVSGIPGSGKTYAISYICNKLERLLSEMAFTFAAPTGRAAKKLKELLDLHNPDNNFSCSTIHRLLRWVFSDKEADVPESVAKSKRGRARFKFSDEDEGLPVGLYTLEETSMVDIFMASSTLSKIPSGSRVALVGDPYQLQSIRCGAFLRDLLDAGVPSIKLETPRRNAGRIVRACCDIKNGVCPKPSPKFDLSIGENWLHFETSEPEDIQKVILSIYQKTKLDKLWDIQMISPQKESDFIGCNAMNKVLSRLLNPAQKEVIGDKKSNLGFTIGDKIIRTKNGTVVGLELAGNSDIEEADEHIVDWTDRESDIVQWNNKRFSPVPTEIVNGDIGICLGSIQYRNKYHVIVAFKNPTRLCILPIADHKLELGYCTTIHKMQGSGARCIIAPFSEVFYSGLVTRELSYTLMSRAEERLYTVGTLFSLGEAVKRKTIDQRQTRLKDFVVDAMKGQ